MKLVSLTLQHFRNHLKSSFEFGGGANVFLGDNGQGKTNVIEAISYLCLTKSFYAAGDSLALAFGEELFEVEGTFLPERGTPSMVRVAYSGGRGEKVFSINKRSIEPFSSVIGRFPVVICSPEHAPITTAGPAERRRFVDFVISQSSAHYFQTLMEYRRVLRQRNKVLSEAKASRKEPGSATGPWDQQLVTLGSSIICKRNEFVTEFHDYIESAYHHLVGLDEQPTMVYEPMVTISQGLQEAHVAEELLSQLEARRIDELRLGATLVGPHRDEFLLTINGLDLRKFASQGQHKTYLVALKLGEFFYLKDRCHETPILLLDDVFSELDRTRAQSLLSYVRELSQTFITSTDPHFFDEALSFGDRDRKFSIRGGAAVEYQPVAAI